jgi:hypothetical protein
MRTHIWPWNRGYQDAWTKDRLAKGPLSQLAFEPSCLEGRQLTGRMQRLARTGCALS